MLKYENNHSYLLGHQIIRKILKNITLSLIRHYFYMVIVFIYVEFAVFFSSFHIYNGVIESIGEILSTEKGVCYKSLVCMLKICRVFGHIKSFMIFWGKS